MTSMAVLNRRQAVFFPIHTSREFEDILCGIKVESLKGRTWAKNQSA
jgi:hypothetical protein